MLQRQVGRRLPHQITGFRMHVVQYSSETQRRGHWGEWERRRQFLDDLGRQKGVEKAEDWLHVTGVEVREAGGGGLLGRYQGSLSRLLADVYPDEKELWEEGRERKLGRPSGYWKSVEHRRAFVRELEERLGVAEAADWKAVRMRDFRQVRGGEDLLRYIKNDVTALLEECSKVTEAAGGREEASEGGKEAEKKAERSLLATQVLPQVPWNHWESQKNRRQFLDEAGRRMGVADVREWGKVTTRDVREMGGGGLLARFSGSLHDALADAYPEYAMSDLGRQRRRGFWQERENRKEFWVATCEKMHLEGDADDSHTWRSVTVQEVRRAGGQAAAGFLSFYGGSLQRAIEDMCQYRCGRVMSGAEESVLSVMGRAKSPHGFWKEEKNVRAFVGEAERMLGISRAEEWQRISGKQLRQLGIGGYAIGETRDSLRQALARVYPKMDWSLLLRTKRAANSKASQRHLAVNVSRLFGRSQLSV